MGFTRKRTFINAQMLCCSNPNKRCYPCSCFWKITEQSPFGGRRFAVRSEGGSATSKRDLDRDFLKTVTGITHCFVFSTLFNKHRFVEQTRTFVQQNNKFVICYYLFNKSEICSTNLFCYEEKANLITNIFVIC